MNIFCSNKTARECKPESIFGSSLYNINDAPVGPMNSLLAKATRQLAFLQTDLAAFKESNCGDVGRQGKCCAI